MSDLEESLSLSNLMLGLPRFLIVDLPASWIMDQLVPSPEDLSRLDIETKLKILRGEHPHLSPAEQWWSPAAWLERTEQLMQNCIGKTKYDS